MKANYLIEFLPTFIFIILYMGPTLIGIAYTTANEEALRSIAKNKFQYHIFDWMCVVPVLNFFFPYLVFKHGFKI